MNPNNQFWNVNDRDNPENISETYSPTPITDRAAIDNQNPMPNPGSPIDDSPVRWTATEYLYQGKNRLWFVTFASVVALLIIFDILWMKSYTFSILVIVMSISLVIYTRRPPRQISYTLSVRQGLYIGERLYPFSEFKSFGLLQNNGNNSIFLTPVKRFSPGVSVYFPTKAGEQIVDIFGARLPMKTVKLDFMDIIVQKLRI